MHRSLNATDGNAQLAFELRLRLQLGLQLELQLCECQMGQLPRLFIGRGNLRSLG